VRFELRDYREVRGQFDRIVSVGMLEHVGARSYDAFFGTIERLISDDGVALIHAISQRRPPGGPSNPWISKYIFPGGYIPALSEIMRSVERVGLWSPTSRF
jgi:cyclopropane-fatty-acyl-phospholipid synthase